MWKEPDTKAYTILLHLDEVKSIVTLGGGQGD